MTETMEQSQTEQTALTEVEKVEAARVNGTDKSTQEQTEAFPRDKKIRDLKHRIPTLRQEIKSDLEKVGSFARFFALLAKWADCCEGLNELEALEQAVSVGFVKAVELKEVISLVRKNKNAFDDARDELNHLEALNGTHSTARKTSEGLGSDSDPGEESGEADSGDAGSDQAGSDGEDAERLIPPPDFAKDEELDLADPTIGQDPPDELDDGQPAAGKKRKRASFSTPDSH